jgi:hypothetical protein
MALIYVKDTSERYANPTAALCSGSTSSRVEDGLARKEMHPKFSANTLQFQSGNAISYKAFRGTNRIAFPGLSRVGQIDQS